MSEPQGLIDADGAWSLWMDVDLPWSLVAGSSRLIGRLVDHPAIEADVVPRG